MNPAKQTDSSKHASRSGNPERLATEKEKSGSVLLILPPHFFYRLP